jgi:exodeoxyribonuclease X
MRLRVIDIETSGGQPSEIIEIAAVDVVGDSEGWIAEPPRSRLFAPRGEISCHAMAVHHLTLDDFDAGAAPCSEAALRDFLWAAERPDALAAHNAAFERQHISAAVTDALPWICTLKAARHAWPEAPGHSNQVLRYWRALKLDPALAMPPHRAAPDAWVTAHILMDLLTSVSVEELLTPRPPRRVPFGRYRGQDWTAPPADYLTWIIGEPEMAREVVARARAELVARGTAAAAPEEMTGSAPKHVQF